MMRFTRLVCGYMSTFLLEMLYTIHACRTRVSSSRLPAGVVPGAGGGAARASAARRERDRECE